jgi:lipopolysaccharide export system permease protein
MKINTIINRYVFTELIPPFALSILFFTFVFLMKTILEVANYVVNYGVGMGTILLFLIYSTPYFLQFIIPMSIMIAVLLTFLKMSSENEIIALKAGGVSVYRLLPPVFLFCLLGCLLTGFMTVYGLPWGKMSFKKLTYQVASSNMDIGLKERTFNNYFKDVLLYVNKIDMQTRDLEDVFIEDQRSKEVVSTVVARKGRLYSEKDRFVFHLRLYDGMINQVELTSKSLHTITFDTYDITLDLTRSVYTPATVEKMSKSKGEMTLGELIGVLKDREAIDDARRNRILLKVHEKFSLPFACFALGLLSISMGLQSKSGKQSLGIVLSLFIFLFYYLILLIGWSLGELGIAPAAVCMWMPNIFMSVVGVYLLITTANDQPLKLDIFINLGKSLKAKFTKSVAVV